MLFFRNNLELKRFKLILQCLHFTSNDAESNDDTYSDKTYKIYPLVVNIK